MPWRNTISKEVSKEQSNNLLEQSDPQQMLQIGARRWKDSVDLTKNGIGPWCRYPIFHFLKSARFLQNTESISGSTLTSYTLSTCEWEKDMYLDGKTWKGSSEKGPFKKPFYLIIYV